MLRIRSRSLRWTVRIIVGFLLLLGAIVLLMFCSGGSSIEDSLKGEGFPIARWTQSSVGAVGWVGYAEIEWEERIPAIHAALSAVFGLWGFEPPLATTLLPSISRLRGIPVHHLTWRGQEAWPLLIVITASPAPIHAGWGSGLVFAPEVGRLFGLKGWEDDTGPSILYLSLEEFDEMLRYGLGLWIVHLACKQEGMSSSRLPALLRGGIGDYAAYADATPFNWRIEASARAEDRTMSLEPHGIARERRALGISLVAYLMESEGPERFLDSLGNWIRDPDAMLEQHRDGWKAFLLSL